MLRSSTTLAAALALLLPGAASFSFAPAALHATRQNHAIPSPRLSSTAIHPAVEGWPAKYNGAIGGTTGPRVMHNEFAVQKADSWMLMTLDVLNWPTWTTAGNDRWVEHVTREDKEMPYGELSYLTKGQLKIVPKATGVPVIVNPGDFVTFPEGFVSDWTVLKELTWHYYLY